MLVYWPALIWPDWQLNPNLHFSSACEKGDTFFHTFHGRNLKFTFTVAHLKSTKSYRMNALKPYQVIADYNRNKHSLNECSSLLCHLVSEKGVLLYSFLLILLSFNE